MTAPDHMLDDGEGTCMNRGASGKPGAVHCRQQNNPSPLQIALQRHRGAATGFKHLTIFLERWTSLASGIIPMLNHDSRSKESGY
jgi:hypothetical protein